MRFYITYDAPTTAASTASVWLENAEGAPNPRLVFACYHSKKNDALWACDVPGGNRFYISAKTCLDAVREGLKNLGLQHQEEQLVLANLRY